MRDWVIPTFPRPLKRRTNLGKPGAVVKFYPEGLACDDQILNLNLGDRFHCSPFTCFIQSLFNSEVGVIHELPLQDTKFLASDWSLQSVETTRKANALPGLRVRDRIEWPRGEPFPMTEEREGWTR